MLRIFYISGAATCKTPGPAPTSLSHLRTPRTSLSSLRPNPRCSAMPRAEGSFWELPNSLPFWGRGWKLPAGSARGCGAVQEARRKTTCCLLSPQQVLIWQFSDKNGSPCLPSYSHHFKGMCSQSPACTGKPLPGHSNINSVYGSTKPGRSEIFSKSSYLPSSKTLFFMPWGGTCEVRTKNWTKCSGFYPVQSLLSSFIQSLTIAQQEFFQKARTSSLPSIGFVSVYGQRLRWWNRR